MKTQYLDPKQTQEEINQALRLKGRRIEQRNKAMHGNKAGIIADNRPYYGDGR